MKYVNLPNMKHLLTGLYINAQRCADVLDETLIAFNKQSGIPDKIVDWNIRGANDNGPLLFPGRGRFIFDINQMYSPSKGVFWTCYLLEKEDEKEKAPSVFFNMRSPSLDIPMRLEIPVRVMVAGSPSLQGTYTVYLHVLLTEQAGDFVYYGITKRNWNVRFIEHTKSALKPSPRRTFAKRMNELLSARASEIYGEPGESPRLRGIVTTLCAVGFTQSAAMEAEEYLVNKYSLSSKHRNGLNMLPGGYAGVRTLQAMVARRAKVSAETRLKEQLFDQYRNG